MLQKLIRGGCTNLSEWFEKIADKFCEERVVEERVDVESIEKRFYNDVIPLMYLSLYDGHELQKKYCFICGMIRKVHVL